MIELIEAGGDQRDQQEDYTANLTRSPLANVAPAVALYLAKWPQWSIKNAQVARIADGPRQQFLAGPGRRCTIIAVAEQLLSIVVTRRPPDRD